MTEQHYEYIVVGKGLMGAAAARHLSTHGPGVALIGPDEPSDRAAHAGVFGNHYDEGRITRILAPDRIWALLAQRSIARYRDTEKRSGRIGETKGILAPPPRKRNPRKPPTTPLGIPTSPASDGGSPGMQQPATAARSKAGRGFARSGHANQDGFGCKSGWVRVSLMGFRSEGLAAAGLRS